ncbi:MAG TPA: ABC transporter permease, partial [Desulfopila sp.]|nr:ABC transporter permease [Desulfopila sp.]
RTTATVLTIVAVSLAVCGYGLFLGLACSTYEQAFMIGATSVVAAAAVGGVMVPVYAMPQLMQQLSILSPINWGLNALQELLIRNSPASAVIGDFFRLAGFALITLLGAWRLSRSRL